MYKKFFILNYNINIKVKKEEYANELRVPKLRMKY